MTTTTTSPSVGAYSQAAFQYTSSDGWTYQFNPAMQGLKVTFSKDVTKSPPGKARFVVSVAAPASFPGAVVGATPGRTPPRSNPPVWVFYPIPDPAPGIASAIPLGNGAQPSLKCAASSYLTYGEKYLAAAGLPSFVGLLCGELYGGSTTPLATTGSVEDTEARVDALLAAVQGVQPVMVVDWGNYCFTVYRPDGSVVLSEGNKECRTALVRSP